MLRFALFFGLGVWAFQQLPALPGPGWLALPVFVAILAWRVQRLRPMSALAIGCTWAYLYALLSVPPALPDGDRVQEWFATGHIVSLVQDGASVSRFVFEVQHLEGQGATHPGRWRLRLSWRDPPPLLAGQAWRLPVRLKPVHGYASPGAWDYEGWLYWQGIRYTGYVRSSAEALRLGDRRCCALTRLRAALATAIGELPTSAFSRGVIRALVVGDQSALAPEHKALFRATGSSHLMAISGLHIGLLAGLGLVAVTWLWRRIPPLCERFPARLAGAIAGSGAALGYALIAGMSLPTQRALAMLLVFALSLVARRESCSLNTLALAAVVVLVWHPPSIVSAGFWLSFGAVLTILAVLALSPRKPRWRVAIRIQLALSLALWPILTAFAMPASWVAPLVNLLLVPLFGLVIVPLSLLGSLMLGVSASLATWGLQWLAELLDLVRQGLLLATQGPWTEVMHSPPSSAALLAFAAGLMLLLAPRGVPIRGAALPLLLVPWLPMVPRVASGDFVLHVLDVGQGTSVVIETHQHTLLYDTGPAYPSGFSTAKAVVAPFLSQRGVARIDRVVLSHGDRDHAGDLASLIGRWSVGLVQSGEPQRVGFGARYCLAGERWSWDGVSFEFLHPAADARYTGNNASCVLRVSNRVGAVLLTGDIEAALERRLVAAYGKRLRSDILLAPHHGSSSSSTAELIEATRPVFVVYTAGWANRYGFPHPAVDQRWRDAGAITLNTARLGTIGFRLALEHGLIGPKAHRLNSARYWWHGRISAAPWHAVSSVDRRQAE